MGTDRPADAPVIIAGGGPVGSSLAIDLALRGVPSIVLERREKGKPFLLRTNMTNVRSMEHFRRWGMADALRRNDPVPDDVQRDVSFVTRLNGHLLLNLPRTYEWSEPLPFASEVAEWAPNEGIEKTMWERVEQLPPIDYRFENEVRTFTQDDDGVSVEVARADGTTYQLRGDYLVVSDGSRGNLRRVLNVRHEGRTLAMSLSWHFRSKQLKEVWSAGPVVSMVYIYNEDRGSDLITPQGPDTWQYFAGPTPEGVDGDDWEQVKQLIFKAVGREIDVEPLSGGAFGENSLLAPRLDYGRVMLAGDAAHMVSPQGGFGMNSGIGDAADLGWKLAALVQGWGGPMLIPSYSIDRREAVRFIQLGSEANHALGAIELVQPGIEEDGPAGDAVREAVKTDILERKLVQFKRMGGQLGYRYSSSPVIVRDGTEQPPPAFADYTPSAAPGNRAPHVWLADGSSLYDHLGLGFTLLDLGDRDTSDLFKHAERRGIPLQVFTPADEDREALRALYARDAALVRSDHHVAWRGDELPADVEHLLDVITGHASWSSR
ncbi:MULTISPECIES: FAD-dependent monooxygenase [unclassified Streptomyces]|uniref:FAD-dependent monooxygenase n=1 Tax=unclassified Streptomyces TaxID=2593676 RepID=UPI00403CDCC3